MLMKIRMPRGLASFLVCALWLGCLYLAGLGLYTEGVSMADDLPAYGARINQIVESARRPRRQFRDKTCIGHWSRNASRTRMPRRQPPPEPVVRGKRKATEPLPVRLPCRRSASARNRRPCSATSTTICIRSTASC